MNHSIERQLHQSIDFVGLRAHATAVGLLQLTSELVRAGVLGNDAVGRIKDAIARDLMLSRPRTVPAAEFERSTRARLDRIFSGEQPLERDPADALEVAPPAVSAQAR